MHIFDLIFPEQVYFDLNFPERVFLFPNPFPGSGKKIVGRRLPFRMSTVTPPPPGKKVTKFEKEMFRKKVLTYKQISSVQFSVIFEVLTCIFRGTNS